MSGKNEFSVMPRRHELKRLFHLLLNAALAVVSYTDLGGKAPCTRPDPLHPASTLHAHAHAHVYPLHTQARIAMLVFAIFAALDSVVAYTAPAFVLSSGAFGKAADEATDLEKSLLKLWGGAARRKVAASYRTRPPSRASFHPALYLGRWPRLYTTRQRRPTGLVTALRQREARFNFSRRRRRVVGCSHRQPRLRKERTRVSCLLARAADRRSVRIAPQLEGHYGE